MGSLIDRVTKLLPSRGPLASSGAQRAFLGVLALAVSAFPLVVQTPPLDLQEGAPAPRTVRAPRAVSYVDEAATERARAEAADSVEPVVKFDAEALPTARDEVQALFATIAEARSAATVEASGTPDAEALVATRVGEALEAALPELAPESRESVAALDSTRLGNAAASASQLTTTVMSRRFSTEELAEAADTVRASAARLPYDEPVRALVDAAVSSVLRPTLVIDDIATDAARQAAADEVEAIVVARQAGENIVVEGTVVTAQDLEIIRRLGLLAESGSVGSLVALIALAGLMIAAAGAYMWRYDPEVWGSTRDLILVCTLFVGMVWVTRVVLWWRPDVQIYVLPVPLAAMLATMLLSAREGMVVAVVTSLAAVMLGFSSGDTVVATLVWSLVGVVGVSFMTERRKMFYVGASLVVSGAALGGIATLASGTLWRDSLEAAGFGALGGLFAAILCYGLLPFFEHIFGITTDVRLLELANPAHPLMRELMTSAPGTYSHSVMTGNLAEAVAEAVGANPLLARVGAYYHDVGKLKRPAFFVENQAGGENPHDGTTPTMSALIITSHVKEGVELAEKHRLPREVIDIIHQHHGTSLVSYFYNKAAEGEGPVYEADFRYDGQKPASREAALVMLADSCEAAVRAVKRPTVTRIEGTVRSVVDAKVADGQLDESHLTLAQIERVVATYARMLASVYHPRVEYPSATPRRSEHAKHPAGEPS